MRADDVQGKHPHAVLDFGAPGVGQEERPDRRRGRAAQNRDVEGEPIGRSVVGHDGVRAGGRGRRAAERFEASEVRRPVNDGGTAWGGIH